MGVRPSLGTRLPLAGVPADLQRIRAGATLHSASGRHAVRLAVVVAGTELLVQRLGLPRGYWAVVAAATVLRPDFAATFTRGAEQMAGTSIGVVIATLIAVAIDPSGWGVVGVVGLLAWATYAVFPASFAAGTALLTAVIVFLLHAVAADSAAIALDRGIDTLIGGAIGLTAYALWPTWSGTSTGQLLADVVDAQRLYLTGVLAAVITGDRLDGETLRPLARRARVNYTDADAAITLSQAEPVRGLHPRQAAEILAGLRRVVYDVHALRVEAAATESRPPASALEPLSQALGTELEQIAARLRDGEEPRELPPARDLYNRALPQIPAALVAAIRISLDELIDAVNTIAATLGLKLP